MKGDVKMNKNMRNIYIYILAFCATVLISFALLILVAFLPQELVHSRITRSAEKMLEEGLYPVVSDMSDGSSLDNFSDAIMLMEASTLNRSGLRSSLTNPMYHEAGDNPVENLYAYTHSEDPGPVLNYYRYWMGFRVPIRFAMMFMHYYQFRRYLAFAFFSLFMLLTCIISKRTNMKIAMTFALSIILVKPNIICDSIQYSTCFFIAFLAMLLVPWIHNNPKYEKLFFLEIGMLTMYFDFYTTPILTFGFPMIYLYILRAMDGQETSWKWVMGNGLTWLVSYGLMWIAKLVLVSLLTPLNGFENSIGLFFHHTNLSHLSEVNFFEMMLTSMQKAWKPLFPSGIDERIGFFIIAALMVYLISQGVHRKIIVSDCRRYSSMLLIALLPMIWFATANRAMQNHYCFQYRSIAMVLWAVGVYFILVGMKCEKNKNLPET